MTYTHKVMPAKYSALIPVYNERECIQELYDSLCREMQKLNDRFEIIFVDDGSGDGSFEILRNLSSKNEDLIIKRLERNYGKSRALQAGFDLSSGNVIITIDGDLQYDVAEIPILLEKLGQGFDAICGWRHMRQDSFSKLVASRLANFIRHMAFGEDIHDVGCSFRAYSRRAFQSLELFRERHRFITAILKKKGFKISEVKVKHYPRLHGSSKYDIIKRFFKSIYDFLDILME